MIVAVPDADPEVALIVVEPAATPLTTPLADTVAVPVLVLDQVMGAPAITLPPASLAVAPNVTVWPATTLAEDGLTVTVAAGGGLTATVADPATPSMVAVMTALPAAAPVTTPVPDTDATPGDPLAQLTGRPPSGCPAASSAVAVSATV